MNNNIKRVRIAKEIEDPYYLKDPKLLELYKKCLPPKDAYYYFPKGDEIIIHNIKKPNKSFRRIYYNVPYTEQEKKWIEDFKAIINSHPEVQLPEYFGDYLHLIFIYSTNCDLNESFQRLVKYLNFCKETFPILITPKSKLKEILNKGFVYVYGRDNRFRPIIIVQCKVFEKFYKDFQTEEILQATYFLCQFLVNNMLIPGQFESWVMIINLSGVSIISLPEPVKKMIPALSDFFLARLYKNYIIGLNFISRIVYKIACTFLDEVTVSKINVLDKKKDPKLFENIRRDNIEEQFGGTAPNLPTESENGFFPPRMPSEHFIKDDENPRKILISEDEYINKYKNGEIPEGCVSPYIYDKLKKEEEEQIPPESFEQKEEIIPQNNNINNSEQKTNYMSFEKSMNLKEKAIIENKPKIPIENNLRRDLVLKKNNDIQREVKSFIINNNWSCEEELSFPKYHKINCISLREDNILDDINKFGRKKQKFISKLSLLNRKNPSIISNY